jgi:hypothetical protein
VCSAIYVVRMCDELVYDIVHRTVLNTSHNRFF